jgi:hypothetical protein
MTTTTTTDIESFVLRIGIQQFLKKIITHNRHSAILKKDHHTHRTTCNTKQTGKVYKSIKIDQLTSPFFLELDDFESIGSLRMFYEQAIRLMRQTTSK